MLAKTETKRYFALNDKTYTVNNYRPRFINKNGTEMQEMKISGICEKQIWEILQSPSKRINSHVTFNNQSDIPTMNIDFVSCICDINYPKITSELDMDSYKKLTTHIQLTMYEYENDYNNMFKKLLKIEEDAKSLQVYYKYNHNFDQSDQSESDQSDQNESDQNDQPPNYEESVHENKSYNIINQKCDECIKLLDIITNIRKECDILKKENITLKQENETLRFLYR